jgi:hypothetical protein
VRDVLGQFGQVHPGVHDAWLRQQHFDTTATQMAFESDYESVLSVTARRDRLDKSIIELAGNSIGSFVGLVPTERSSGSSRVQGSITKTGNTHARRLLVEAAWHHRPAYRPGKTMRDRWERAEVAARARGDAGNRRLHERWVTFNLRHKRSVIANVAIARELAGWC